MDRSEKQELVKSLRTTFEDASIVVVTHYSGLSVAEMEDLRAQMRGAGASFKVTKNRITRLALEGTKFQGISDLFAGPTAIAYSDDPVAAAKVAVKFSRENDNFAVIGGGLGEDVLDLASINALATLPSMDELRGKIVGMINTPATRIAGVLQAPAGQIARVIGAHSSQG